MVVTKGEEGLFNFACLGLSISLDSKLSRLIKTVLFWKLVVLKTFLVVRRNLQGASTLEWSEFQRNTRAIIITIMSRIEEKISEEGLIESFHRSGTF